MVAQTEQDLRIFWFHVAMRRAAEEQAEWLFLALWRAQGQLDDDAANGLYDSSLRAAQLGVAAVCERWGAMGHAELEGWQGYGVGAFHQRLNELMCHGQAALDIGWQ